MYVSGEQVAELLEAKLSDTRDFSDELTTVTPASTLDDLDLDSLDVVEFALMLSRRFGVPLRDVDLEEAQTPTIIADLINTRQGYVGV